MAFDTFETVRTPDGDTVCIDCCRKRGFDPDGDDVTPIFSITEETRLPVCDGCGYISQCCSFGGEAVDDAIEKLAEWLMDVPARELPPQLPGIESPTPEPWVDHANYEYLDAVAEHLRWCVMDDEDEAVLDAYREARSFMAVLQE